MIFKNKKTSKSIFALLLMLVFIIFSVIIVFAKSKVEVYTGYNIVFVIDNSDSLKRTDPARLRQIGLSKILSWLPGTRSRAGLVIFDTQAKTYAENLILIEDKDDVINLSAQVPTTIGVWTNITDGLSTALNFIIESKGTDPSLKNLIILFSDGNIDLPNKSEIEHSREELLKLSDEAKSEGIEIATIALNDNGEANVSDMEDISTSGLFIEVTNANDLESAFKKLHESKFKAETTQLKEGNNYFWVEVGASALNLNFEPQNADDDFILTSPLNQKSYTKNSSEVYQIGNVYVLNIPNPTYGRWKCELTGGTGTGVTVVPDDDFILSFLSDLIKPLPSSILMLFIEALLLSAISKMKSRLKRFFLFLFSFVLTSGLYALIYYGGAIFENMKSFFNLA